MPFSRRQQAWDGPEAIIDADAAAAGTQSRPFQWPGTGPLSEMADYVTLESTFERS